MSMTLLRRIGLHLSITACLVSTVAILPALAQPRNSSRAEFPGRRIGGGTRSECLVGNQPLVALNPANNLGVTASDRPSVYFVVPTLNKSYPVEFVLRNSDGNTVYKKPLEAGKTKVVGIHLPEKTLELGQDYQWYFSIVCDSEDPSQNIVVSGWLRQVSPRIALKDKSSLESKLDLAKSYHNAGLWSDEIATLVELRQSYPDNDKVRLQWQQLLQKLDLERVFQRSVASHL